MPYDFTLQDGIIQHSDTFDGTHYMDANRKGLLVGPITVSGTLYVQGDLNVLNDIDITGTLDITGDGTLSVS